MKIKFIIGEAGTAKTSTLVRISKEVKGDFIALAFTHSACNNMIEKGIQSNKVKTLHSYFRIMPDSTFINMPIHIPNFILIDEFSLIPVDLLEQVFKMLAECNVVIVLAGDLLQLPPVEENRFLKIDNINLNGSCSLTEAKAIFNHLGRSIYGNDFYNKADKLILNKNYRLGSEVMNILTDVFKNGCVECIKITELSKLEEFVFIASTYKNLKRIYKEIFNIPKECQKIPTGFFKNVEEQEILGSSSLTAVKTRMGKTIVDYNLNYILTKNINENFYNGDYVKLISVEPKKITIKQLSGNEIYELEPNEFNNFDLLPENFMTVHYAQGRGFKNVCLCVDDLFELSMLYTGITRAREKIKFVSFTGVNNLEQITKPFNIVKNNIYQGDTLG